MKNIINTAIAGFGLSGKAFHAPFIHVNKGFALCTVLERHRDDSHEQFPYVTIARELDDILNDKEIELVVICTPNIHHFDMAKAAIQAGKNVIIDKPFVNSTHEAEELINLAKSQKVHLFVYQNRRWDGDFLTIKKICKSGVLGDIQYFEAHFDSYSPERKRAVWRDKDLPGSGILFDLGSHLIDQALLLFGVPHSLEADIQTQRENAKADDYFLLTLYYKHTIVKLTACMLVKDPGPRYIIHGSRGSFIKYGIDPQEAALRRGAMPDEPNWGEESPDKWGLITIDFEDLNFDGRIETEPGNYMAFYNNVYDVLVNNKEQAVKPEESAMGIKIIEKAIESSKTGKMVQGF